jgi:hypothetical protein
MSTGTGRFPLKLAQVTRRWDETEWAAAVERLAARGWVADDGTVTPAGVAARDGIEDDTDRLCASIWDSVGEAGAARFAELIAPINTAMTVAGTYGGR